MADQKEPDVEAPAVVAEKKLEEDPSVVLTADDDSSVGTSEADAAAAANSGSSRAFSYWKVAAALAGGIAVVVVVLAITCPFSKNSSDRVQSLSMQDLLGDFEDTPYDGNNNKPPCNKTKKDPTTTTIATAPAHTAPGDDGDPVCLPGYQPTSSGDGCDPCPTMTYKDTKGSYDCYPCPVGTMNSGTGNFMCLTDPNYDPHATLKEDFPKQLPFESLPPIQSFTPDVLNGYTSVDELKSDLTTATKHMLNRIILQNVYNDFMYTSGQRPAENNRPLRPVASVAATAQAAGATAATASAGSKTNNQEEGADEADHVKNDEHYVYASYGDYVVVWDRQHGTQIASVHIPGNNPTNPDGTRNANAQWSPPTYINGLLLTPTKVVVLVDGLATANNEEEYLHSNQGTQIRIYSKPTPLNQEMRLLETQTVNGMYRDGRYLEESQTLHLLTTGDINAYSHLIAPLQMYRFSSSIATPQDYVQAATELATTKLIPEFVEGVSRALMVNDRLPNLIRVNDWSDHNASDNNNDTATSTTALSSVDDFFKTMKQGELSNHNFYEADIPMKAFAQIVSIQTEAQDAEATTATTTTKLSSSVILVPTTETEFYANSIDDNLVVAVTHSYYDETTLQARENLFLLHMKATTTANDTTDNAALVSFHSVATLPGHINSPYSLDIQGTDLRIATTQQLWTPLDRVWPLCGVENSDWLVEEKHNDDSDCRTDESFNQCFEMAINGCQTIEKSGCPYVYACADDEETIAQQEESASSSSTENHVIVFDISQPGAMKEIGRVQIGEPHEVITAVRFGETFSYAMTFDQRDPFYVLRLEAGQAPAISGSLKLDGFSRYLHPLNPEATMLVGIGQNVTGTGLDLRASGVMLTVFDVSDPALPVVVASHQLENEDKIDSSTLAEWDAKAVQYANGKLVLPVSLYHHTWDEIGDDETFFRGRNMDDFVSAEEEEEGDAVSPKAQEEAEEEEKENFEGFIVYDIGSTGIEEAFRINFLPAEGEDDCHYCSGGLLSSRSIIFEDGSLMTMHGDSVQSNNLDTGSAQWQMNITLPGVSKTCCW